MTSNDNKVELYGLVLSGGKSTRMGRDKGHITYHQDKPQQEYLYELLDAYCSKTFMSVRSEQTRALPDHFNYITDNNQYRGPFNGMLSAHDAYPNVAWLVLACDLPLMDEASIQQLIQERSNSHMATAFARREENPLPEPLCAIWEPQALQQAKAFLDAQQSTCPRKFLINNATKLTHPAKDEVLFNANALADYEEAKRLIAEQE